MLVNSCDGFEMPRCYNDDLDVSSPMGVTKGIHRAINEADARIVGNTCGGDDDAEDEPEYDMVTNLSCSNCDTFVLVYYKEPEDEPTDGNVHTGE